MKIKIAIIIILGVLFVITSVISLVNASKLLSEGFKVALKYDECSYAYPRIPIEEAKEDSPEIEKEVYCVNNKKRNIAESLAYLIISLPISLLLYRKLINLWKK